MKIPFNELCIQDIESFYKILFNDVSKLKDKSFILDFIEVERVDLSAIQLIISLKKYCDSLDISLELININSSQLKQSIQIFNLENILGIKL
jgi:ABC-type transporter Mla MlaB component